MIYYRALDLKKMSDRKKIVAQEKEIPSKLMLQI